MISYVDDLLFMFGELCTVSRKKDTNWNSESVVLLGPGSIHCHFQRYLLVGTQSPVISMLSVYINGPQLNVSSHQSLV